ncbi:MAG: hypothetical protein FWC40_01455 [Proteobacteria bacterium]|nr:hypothetical protein [Pseudomonadota bacterium]
MQEVNYAVLAGCSANELLPKLGLVANFIVKEKPDAKALKRFFREHDFFDKERHETLLAFLGIDASQDKHIKAGDFLTQLLKIIDPEDRKRHLYRYLTAKNQILMKYVMDAIGERLHSTNEMYRYLTSYVYPGTYLTLVDFRYWMLWLEASEHIRMVGIRWGLSDLGKEAMDKIIKFIDIDDLLDAEGGDGDDDDDDDDDDDVDEGDKDDDDAGESLDDDEAAGDVVEAQDAGVSKPLSVLPDAVPGGHRERAESFGHEVSAAPHVRAAMASDVGAGAVRVSASRVEVYVQPLVPRSEETPLLLVQEAFLSADAEEAEDEEGEVGSAASIQIGQLRLDEMLVSENLRAVQSWWRMRPGGRVLTASDYGFEAETFKEDALFGLFRLSALALQLFRYCGRLNTSRGGQSFAMFDQMGFYSNLLRSSRNVDDILSELLDGGLGQRADDFSNLHFLLIIRRGLLRLGCEGVEGILAAPSVSDVVAGLWQHVGQFQLTYEVLWLVRELGALGVLSCEDWESAGVVPLPKVRETAFRLGFIETPYAADFGHLVSISRRLSKFFGLGDGWEAPLVYFEPRRDLRYDTAEASYFTRDQLGLD